LESVVIDSFAWIEYFAGSEQGEKAKRYIETGDAITPSIVMAEFTDKYARERMDSKERLAFIRTKSMILPLDDEMAELSGRISAERRSRAKGWGIVDSIVLATARTRDAKIVTGDEHFRDLGKDQVIMIK
jgi:predicted nucleic acid-binding protein